MGKARKTTDPIVLSLSELAKRLNVLIALSTTQSKQPEDKVIRLLAKQGLSYNDIENILGVSSATVAKVLRKK